MFPSAAMPSARADEGALHGGRVRDAHAHRRRCGGRVGVMMALAVLATLWRHPSVASNGNLQSSLTFLQLPVSSPQNSVNVDDIDNTVSGRRIARPAATSDEIALSRTDLLYQRLLDSAIVERPWVRVIRHEEGDYDGPAAAAMASRIAALRAKLQATARRRRRYPPPFIDFGGPDAAAANDPGNVTHPSCLVVYHIPKTGGISLGEYLKVFAKAMRWTYHEWYSYHSRHGDAPIRSMTFPIRNASVLHIGHLTPRFAAETQTRHCARLTLLWDPVDRVVSAFYYHRHAAADWDACLAAAAANGTACRHGWEYANDVTRRFTDHATAWNSYRVTDYLQNDPLTEVSLRQAQATLATFQFVCFTDRMRDCIRRLGRHYRLELDLPVDVVRNRNSKRVSVSENHKECIARRNGMDLRLYDWARARFGGGGANGAGIQAAADAL